MPSRKSGGKPARAPTAVAPVRRAVARIRRPFGVRGAVLVDVLTDNMGLLLTRGAVTVGESHRPLEFERLTRHGQDAIAQIVGIQTWEQAERLRGEVLWVRADLLPALPEGVFYHYQILGLQVLTDDGRPLGKVVEILQTGANDVYVVRGEAGETLLPAIQSVILRVAPEEGMLIVHLIEGLIPES